MLVTNNTKTKITINVNSWVKPDGEKISYSLPYNFEIEPGKATYLVTSGKIHIVAKKIDAYVETKKGRKRYTWEYKSGVNLNVNINESSLP